MIKVIVGVFIWNFAIKTQRSFSVNQWSLSLFRFSWHLIGLIAADWMDTLKLALIAYLVTLCCGVIFTAGCGWQRNPTMLIGVKTVARLMENNGMMKNALGNSNGPVKIKFKYIFHDMFQNILLFLIVCLISVCLHTLELMWGLCTALHLSRHHLIYQDTNNTYIHSCIIKYK